MGDVQNTANSQSLTSLAGKILRVNSTDGSAPGDNPFFSNANPMRKKSSVSAIGIVRGLHAIRTQDICGKPKTAPAITMRSTARSPEEIIDGRPSEALPATRTSSIPFWPTRRRLRRPASSRFLKTPQSILWPTATICSSWTSTEVRFVEWS
ncbi:MAG: PQQ-dependent sugar dehydrogenase [Nitrospiraceae bacterium]